MYKSVRNRETMKSNLKITKMISVMFIISLVLFLTTCGGGGRDAIQFEAEGVIGSEGGVIEVIDTDSPIYGAKIEIPEGALEEQKVITIAKTTKNAPAPKSFNAGEYINFGPNETNFNEYVTCTIPYKDYDNDGILDGTDILETNLSVYTYTRTSKSWDKVPVINQDLSNNLLVFKTNHFSQYVASPYKDSNYVWPVYINENALVYDELPDYENNCKDGSVCWEAFSTGLSIAVGYLFGSAAGFFTSVVMAIPLAGGGGDFRNYAEVSLMFDSDQLVKGDSVYNDFNHIFSTIAYPLIRIETDCGNYNAMKILVYESDSKVSISLYEQEVLSEAEMNTYTPRFIVLRKPIDFSALPAQLVSNSFFQVTSPPPSYGDWGVCEDGDVSYVTIQKSGLLENYIPQLSNGSVNPTSGDTSTTFTYSVDYYDPDGDPPTISYVNIDGVDYTMTLSSGTNANGTYTYSTQLSPGNHSYYFRFSDGVGDVRLPRTGMYSDPDVSDLFEWQIQTVDSIGDVGMFPSIALDINGYPHISYLDYINFDLKYVRWSGSSWLITTMDSIRADYGTSIALDSDGYPHISYQDIVDDDLKYAKWTGSSWLITTVDSVGDVGMFPSMALDSNGYSHISYVDYTNNQIKYARWTGSNWSIETLLDRVYWHSAIALDSSGYPHISYVDYPNGVKYARHTGSSWSIETVDVDGEEDTSIAIDSDGYPHIIYYSYYDNICKLKYAKWMGSSWSITTVDSIGLGEYGSMSDIALDRSGYPHISYYDKTNKDLKYAKWTGDSWSITTVDSVGAVGLTNSIALDTNGYPHISYYDVTNGDLKYATIKP